MEPLQAQEDSPFIGQLDPGKHQLAIETGMFRAPGFAYSAPATDFLLIRNATGAVFLRELTGCIAVGQQVPAMRTPTPNTRDVRYVTVGQQLTVRVPALGLGAAGACNAIADAWLQGYRYACMGQAINFRVSA